MDCKLVNAAKEHVFTILLDIERADLSKMDLSDVNMPMRQRKDPDMSNIRLTAISEGHATVVRGDREVGVVDRIEYPHSRNGEIDMEMRWEARAPWQVLEVNDFGYPTFPTRREAVAYLTETY